MGRIWLSYEVILKDAEGNVIDKYDSTSKTRVKDVFKELYVKQGFPQGVTGLYQRATEAFRTGTEEPYDAVHAGKIRRGEPYTNGKGWTLHIETTTGRSLI